MKLLSIVVPCYNSEKYMKKAIESLLIEKERVEIIIVNDGSTDRTKEIADNYVKRYPNTIRAIHQKNSGHGGAINSGLNYAAGLFFKVLDSDDWFDEKSYIQMLDKIEEVSNRSEQIDLFLSNFVYEKEGQKKKKTMRYKNVMPENCSFSWDEMKLFKKGQYIMMHSMIYRTSLLRKSGLQLPENTFYVDNLFVYVPLALVENLFYVDVDLYRYYIGREDQSVNEKVMIRQIDQQIKVNKLMIEAVNLNSISIVSLRDYMMKHLEILTVISSIMLLKSGTKENLKKKKELLEFVKESNIELFILLKYGLLGRLINLPTKFGHFISIGAYKISQKVIGFN